jgi:hypothetical protein
MTRLETDHLAHMSRASRAGAFERFTPERPAESYAAIFREALADTGTVAPQPWSAFELNENCRFKPTAAARAFSRRTLVRAGLWRAS